MLIHLHFIPSFFCHIKTTVTCVTWPELAVCRWIYIRILHFDSLSRKNYRNVCHMAKLAICRLIYFSNQYVDSLSRKNYRNACHMAKMLYFFIAYTSIFYSILLLSHENYRNMCHSPNSLFLSAYTSIFQNNSGIV